MRIALTIAGSDSGAGAGIQADLKTMMASGVYGVSVITAITAQNTLGVQGIWPVSDDALAEQLRSVFTDLTPAAVKIGMIPSPEQVEIIAEALRRYDAKNVVIDPVLRSTSGRDLSGQMTRERLKELLFPLARLITPNLPETGILTGLKIESDDQAERAGRRLCDRYGCAVLVKGGHRSGGADDVLIEPGRETPLWFRGERIPNPNNHGTGCTLSSAIAAGLARGLSLPEAVRQARAYLRRVLEAGLDLGAGNGPMDHGAGQIWPGALDA